MARHKIYIQKLKDTEPTQQLMEVTDSLKEITENIILKHSFKDEKFLHDIKNTREYTCGNTPQPGIKSKKLKNTT